MEDKTIKQQQPSRSALTRGELAVLHAMEQCGNALGAAESLCVSKQTVYTHLRNVRRKLGVTSTLAAIATLLAEQGSGLPPPFG